MYQSIAKAFNSSVDSSLYLKTILNENLRLKMEPRTVTAKQRLLTIEKPTKANIPVAVIAAPIIPNLNIHEITKIIAS